jgi:molybdopterin/thiamine biosynthesis adenylyltransferase
MISEVRFPEPVLKKLRSHLFDQPAADVEQAAFLYAGRAIMPGRRVLLVRNFLPVPEEGYLHRGKFGFELTDEFRLQAVLKARHSDLHLIEVHSHPFVPDGEQVAFSTIDERGQRELHRYLSWKLPGQSWGALVFARGSVAGTVWNPGGPEPEKVDLVTTAGARILPRSGIGPMTEANRVRFERHSAFGPESQRLIMSVKVGLIGAGGLGSAIAQQLALLGIRHIVLVDADTLEGTNLNRQVGAIASQLGCPKVDSVCDHFKTITGAASVERIPSSIRSSDTLSRLIDCDVLIAAVDHEGPRDLLCQFAAAYLIPLFDASSDVFPPIGARGVEARGEIFCWTPGDPCHRCAGVLDQNEVLEFWQSPDERELRKKLGYGGAERLESPSVIHINSRVAGSLVLELHSRVAGFQAPTQHVMIRSSGPKREWITRDRLQEDCPVCAGLLGLGDYSGVLRLVTSRANRNVASSA